MKSSAAAIFKQFLAMTAIILGLMFSTGYGLEAAAESELTLAQILDRMEAQYTDKSFKAEFTQESTLKAMDITEFAAGKVYCALSRNDAMGV